MNTRFTIEEENIVAIYAEDSRETTLENILAAMPYMDEDMRQLAAAAVNKLQAMTDSEFSEREFILTDEERIQHQYDALAKKTLVGEAKSHRRTLAKRAAREVTFSDLSESELAQLFTTDEYESDYFRFQVSGFDVLVKNELLAEALNALPERKRDIILLSYFLDMSDAEIGELLNVVRTTVFRHRKSALAKIKQYLEGKADDEYR